MNNLVATIGPAPSEDVPAFEARLAKERLRIMTVLTEIRAFVPASKVATPRKRKDPYDLSEAEFVAAMKEMGLETTEQIIAKIKELETSGTDDQDD